MRCINQSFPYIDCKRFIDMDNDEIRRQAEWITRTLKALKQFPHHQI